MGRRPITADINVLMIYKNDLLKQLKRNQI